jgi:hypothetical protein
MTAAPVQQEAPAGVDPFVPPVGAHADAGRHTHGLRSWSWRVLPVYQQRDLGTTYSTHVFG